MQDHEFTIKVSMLNTEKAEDQHLASCLARCARYYKVREIHIAVGERVSDDAPLYQNPGWLESRITIRFIDGGQLVLGAIERTKGSQIEFHS